MVRTGLKGEIPMFPFSLSTKEIYSDVLCIVCLCGTECIIQLCTTTIQISKKIKSNLFILISWEKKIIDSKTLTFSVIINVNTMFFMLVYVIKIYFQFLEVFGTNGDNSISIYQGIWLI